MLRVERLRHRAGAFQLEIDDWTIEPGQYAVLVGPSGAGKTMFLETMAGLRRPDVGRIWIDGRDVTHDPPEARGIGFVYQDCWLFPHMTVRQNIDFGRRYHREANGGRGIGTEELAGMLHIGDLLDRRPATLSGGERQRVAIARALATRPRLLFLDEPLGTLDPSTRERVAAELQSCHRTLGTATIHVTHDHTEARMLGTAAAVMLRGRFEQSGPTDDVFQRPRTIELAGFLGCENLFETEAIGTGSPDQTRVRIGDASMDVRSGRAGKVALCVRPEEVLVEPADGVSDASATPITYNVAGSLSGRLVETSRRGATVRLVIDAAGRRWVSLISQSQQREGGFAPGDAVRLRIPADAVHLIPLAQPDGK